jgi:hypothetical protein
MKIRIFEIGLFFLVFMLATLMFGGIAIKSAWLVWSSLIPMGGILLLIFILTKQQTQSCEKVNKNG